MSAGGGAFRQIGPDPGRDALRSAAIAVSTPQRLLLLQLRDDRPGVTAGGLWGLFGGGAHAGERIADAALREFAEETGVRVDAAAIRPFVRVTRPGSPGASISVFRAVLDIVPSDIRLTEGAGFGFFTPAQLADLPIAPILKPVIEAYLSET